MGALESEEGIPGSVVVLFLVRLKSFWAMISASLIARFSWLGIAVVALRGQCISQPQ